MLIGLSIRDIVLIDTLELSFRDGLCVLTGETGAGKSILLDALGLALGKRAERTLVRVGTAKATAIATFALPAGHPAQAILDDNDLDIEDGELVLRRSVTADGRSRAFVNDQPVSTALLRQLGDSLLEVHGQHDTHGLLAQASHRGILDAFGQLDAPLADTRRAYQDWQARESALRGLRDQVSQAQREEDYLRSVAEELTELDPKPDEENALAELRARLMHREKLVGGLEDVRMAAAGEDGALTQLGRAERQLVRLQPLADAALSPAVAAFERAAVELAEGIERIEAALRGLDEAERDLEAVEERLFALRAAARKHRCEVDALPALCADMVARLEALDAGADRLTRAEAEAQAARRTFEAAAAALSAQRRAAAARLAEAVMAELPPLKMERARFSVDVTPLEPEAYGPHGMDRVAFLIATNPGQPPGPLGKIASGGELARFMLALKVVLARTGAASSMVFDEVDAGIGGATADAVGERLARLGGSHQVLVVTHSPQIAARARAHWQVAKHSEGEATWIDVKRLDESGRRNEIARMLAGSAVTDAARAAADSLLANSA